mgnify:FL=1
MTRALIALAALLAMGSAVANDKPDPPHRTLLGYVESITLQPVGLRLAARLDTGAKTSALHSVQTEVFEREGDK